MVIGLEVMEDCSCHSCSPAVLWTFGEDAQAVVISNSYLLMVLHKHLLFG